MELKVVCYCGQKYKFDVEPVNERMPFAVACPVCGVDGTRLANQLLSQHFFSAAAPAAAPAALAAPLPVAGGLKIDRQTSVAAPPPLPSAPGRIAPLKPAETPKVSSKEFSMGLGILGAFLGAALVYGFFKWAGFRFPWSGVGIGALSGYGARLLARGTDMTLGFVAGAMALVSIVGVFYLMYGGFFIFGIISIIICVAVAYRLASG